MTPAPRAIIGIWDGHDAGAALLVDGRIRLAVNEERLGARKLEIGWPSRSLDLLRAEAGPLWDEAYFVLTTSDPAKTLTRLWPAARERYYRLRRRLEEPRWTDRFTRSAKYRLTQWPSCAPLVAWTRRYAARALGVTASRVSVAEHHAAHAAAAAYWPEWDRDALVVTLDGIGDGLSGSVWRLSNADGALAPLVRLPGSASFGLFFEHVTEVLQMRPLEDEGKVMALATFAAALPDGQNPFADWFRLERRSTDGLPEITCRIPPTRMRREVERVAWRLPREQVCRAAQTVLEHLVPAFFSALAETTGVHDFAYAGGVASNIKVNRLVRLAPGVRRLAVCPAMGDGGLALGAACFAWRTLTGLRPAPFEDFRLGPDHGDLGAGIDARLRPGERVLRPADLAAHAADLVASGEVVMWAQGRMELGPRALGARSIVARADSEAARDALNLRLKRRVWFQPFCPSILESEAPRLLADFRGPADANRHMTMGYLTTPEGRRALAGAIGPDGSCRPQLVAANPAEPWFRLLEAVRTRTGTGAVINTSLNVHGHPMPDAAADILDAWRQSGVPHLMLGTVALQQGIAA
jgi:carbamoyltransferase